jgi:hypothetical protein
VLLTASTRHSNNLKFLSHVFTDFFCKIYLGGSILFSFVCTFLLLLLISCLLLRSLLR